VAQSGVQNRESQSVAVDGKDTIMTNATVEARDTNRDLEIAQKLLGDQYKNLDQLSKELSDMVDAKNMDGVLSKSDEIHTLKNAITTTEKQIAKVAFAKEREIRQKLVAEWDTKESERAVVVKSIVDSLHATGKLASSFHALFDAGVTELVLTCARDGETIVVGSRMVGPNRPKSSGGNGGTRQVLPRVELVAGAKYSASYKGQSYNAEIVDGKVTLNGKSYTSLSGAGSAITNYPVNGNKFWVRVS
jgi:hypothetical protein